MRALKVVAYAALTLWAVLTLLPLYWMLVTAFKTQVAVQAIPPDWWPNPPTIGNFAVFFGRAPAFRWLFNSALVSTVVTLTTLLFASMAGYAFAKLSFPGQRLLFWLTMSILVVPFEVKLVPLFELMVRWDMVDTYFGLILPAIAAPFSIFLMKQFMTTLPSEVFDAARIDGASELGVFWRVVLPLSVPGLTVLAIFTFIGNWNAFIWLVIVTRSIEMRTLPPALAVLQTQSYTDYVLQMAGSTFAAIPTVALFLALQRYFLRGITIGALKG